MEWTVIDIDGTEIQATDFLDGVLVRGIGGAQFCQGWHIVDRGDMDGPQLRERPERSKTFSIKIVEEV